MVLLSLLVSRLLILSFLSLLLLLIVDHEVVVDASEWLVCSKDLEHSLSNTRVDLLAVSTLTNWFVLIERVFDMDELSVGYVLDMDPFDFY